MRVKKAFIDVDELKRRVCPIDFYLRELPDMPKTGNRTGWVCGGRSPLRMDRHPGSFKINLDSGAYRDFASGDSGRDIVAFVQDRYGYGFQEALHYIAGAMGVRL